MGAAGDDTVCATGVDAVRWSRPPTPITTLPEVPVLPPDVAVKVPVPVLDVIHPETGQVGHTAGEVTGLVEHVGRGVETRDGPVDDALAVMVTLLAEALKFVMTLPEASWRSACWCR